MPVAGKTFEIDQFRRCVALFESSISGEAASAIRMALKICADCNLRFCDAAALAYGDDHAGEIAQLKEDISRCKEALAARERDTAELIDRYEAKLAQAGNAANQMAQSHRSVRDFLAFTWSFAQWRLALLLVAITCACGMSNRIGSLAGVALFLFVLWLFLLWCAAEIDQSGWGRLLIKCCIVGAGSMEALASHDFSAVLIMGGVALVAATKLINNICDRLMGIPVIAAVVGWFV
jgi:hypothetical protein